MSDTSKADLLTSINSIKEWKPKDWTVNVGNKVFQIRKKTPTFHLFGSVWNQHLVMNDIKAISKPNLNAAQWRVLKRKQSHHLHLSDALDTSTNTSYSGKQMLKNNYLPSIFNTFDTEAVTEATTPTPSSIIHRCLIITLPQSFFLTLLSTHYSRARQFTPPGSNYVWNYMDAWISAFILKAGLWIHLNA